MHKTKFNDFLKRGVDLEAKVKSQGLKIRDKSKNAYGEELISARLILLSIAHYLLDAKANIPGMASEKNSNLLLLISAFYQSSYYIEDLISEGQYVKATAGIKQDYEILARIGTINNGLDKYGIVPNVKSLPEQVRRYYGELNDVAHISKSDLLDELLLVHDEGEITAVSPIPAFNENIAKNLYELHIYLMVSVIQQQIILFKSMYEDADDFLETVYPYYITVTNILKEAGFIVE